MTGLGFQGPVDRAYPGLDPEVLRWFVKGLSRRTLAPLEQLLSAGKRLGWWQTPG